MSTSLTTRITDGPGVETVKGTPLSSIEIDTNFITLAENKVERENNLSDLTDPVAARANIGAPDRDGSGAFGTWGISITGNSGTASVLQNARTINGVAFDGSADISITAAAPENLIFGTGLTSTGSYDGSTERIVSINTDDVVATTGNQSISGIKSFASVVVLDTQATATTHAVRADRTITAGTGLLGGGDLTDDVTLSVDSNEVVVPSGDQTIDGTKTFSNPIVLSVPGTQTTHTVRADRSVLSGDGLNGGSNLTADIELSVDNTVVRTTGNQTLGGTKTFTNPPVMSNPSTSIAQAVRSDRQINSGDGLEGGGNLTSDLTVSVDNTVVRTSSAQTVGGQKTFTSPVVLSVQGSAATEALAAGRSVSTGSGLTGGGDLTADRTISVDNTVVRTTNNQTIGGIKTFSDSIILTTEPTSLEEPVRGDRTITAGDGLVGGGDLTGDRSFAVDNTVVRTSGNYTFTGDYIFTGEITLSNQAADTGDPVRGDREILGGDGLSGGGNLTSDHTLSVDGTVVRTSRNITAGDGLTGGGTLGSDVSVSVDTSVARGGTSTTLSPIWTLVVGEVLSSDGLAESDIDSAGDSDVTDSDLILDSDYADLSIGEVVVGQFSDARGVVVDVFGDSDAATIDVRMISGTFAATGEVIEGQDSGELIEIESASVSETFTAQDVRSSGEVIDFIPSSTENIENVLDIPNALDKVLAIGGKTFDWTDDHLSNKGGADGYHVQQSDFGVVAEDVESVFPQGVREKENGELVVDYRKLFALAFAAIKELNDKIV